MILRDSHRVANVDFFAVEFDLRRPGALDDDVDLIARALRQDHQEFVATEADGNVAGANRALEAP